MRAVPSLVRSRGIRISAQRIRVPSEPVVPKGRPQGVDLNLCDFDLSAPSEARSEDRVGTWGKCISESGRICTNAFWTGLGGGPKSEVAEQDRKLLQAVFNPHLCDRRDDGDRFIPPDTSFSFVQRLKQLVREEEEVRDRRKTHFFSTEFTTESIGPVFPSSWSSRIAIADGQIKHKAVPLSPRPEYKSQADLFDHALKTSSPVFDKVSEDGVRFRIYRIGSLEVRTTQDHGSSEDIGMVFSTCTAADASLKGVQELSLDAADTISKVTEYVENHRHYYVVLETGQGHLISTERSSDGTLTWEENPSDVKDRNSLGKVFCSLDCRAAGLTVGKFRSYYIEQAELGRLGEGSMSSSTSKRFAHAIFDLALFAVDSL